VPTIFEIRTSVLENSATREALESEGITEEVVATELRTHRCGWVAEDSGTALGFSMANPRDGSVFALFVRPGFERRGCGGALLKSAVDWLFHRGFDQLCLEVGPQTRAHAFYRKRGWVETGLETNGDVVVHLARDQKQSGSALDQTAAQPVAAPDGGHGILVIDKGSGRRR